SVEYDLLTSTGDRVTVEAPRLDWDGLSPLTAIDLASPPLVDEEETSALDQAREFLREVLAAGPLLADEVYKAAKHAGVAKRTLERAKTLARVKTSRRPLEKKASQEWPWEWSLSEKESPSPSGPSTGSPRLTHTDGGLGGLENRTTKSMTYEYSSRAP